MCSQAKKPKPKSRIVISTSAITGVRNEHRATAPIHSQVKFPMQAMYISPIHQVIQSEQLKGLCILAVCPNHFVSIYSASSTNPDRSIMNTTKQVIINKLNNPISPKIVFFYFSKLLIICDLTLTRYLWIGVLDIPSSAANFLSLLNSR